MSVINEKLKGFIEGAKRALEPLTVSEGIVNNSDVNGYIDRYVKTIEDKERIAGLEKKTTSVDISLDETKENTIVKKAKVSESKAQQKANEVAQSRQKDNGQKTIE